MAVLDGFPVFTPNEREQYLAGYLAPFHPEAQGAHLAWLWSRVRDQFRFFPWNYRGDGARLRDSVSPPERLNLVAMDILQAGDGYRTGYAAAFRHDTNAALAKLDVPITAVARDYDVLFPHLDRSAGLPKGSRVVRLVATAMHGARSREIFLTHAAAAAPAPAATKLLSAGRPACSAGPAGAQRSHARWRKVAAGRSCCCITRPAPHRTLTISCCGWAQAPGLRA